MALVSISDLLQSGVHFGHRVSRWNPKMKPYIYGKRNLIHIINLRETIKGLIQAYEFCKKLASEGQEVLFVGTKRQARKVAETEAARCQQHYVSERWIGGTITNYTTISSRLKRLLEIESQEAAGTLDLFTKKEKSMVMREKRKLKRNLDGLRNMKKLPAALIIADPRREKNAVAEARKSGISVIALIDTDGDPSSVDIPIPGNDDAMRVIQIVFSRLADAVIDGKAKYAIVLKAIEDQRKADEEARKKKQAEEAKKLDEARKAEAAKVEAAKAEEAKKADPTGAAKAEAAAKAPAAPKPEGAHKGPAPAKADGAPRPPAGPRTDTAPRAPRPQAPNPGPKS
ncbi:MAG: 30S ribosomal protein S2 [Planctomycetes bacterium]|nr:30S ribosomal protein S2 [Planctomycetota bacterium]